MRARRRFVLGLVALLMLAGWAPFLARGAETPDAPARTVQRFYDTLLESMKAGNAAGIAGRYEMLRPAIDEAFDIPMITRFSIGPAWRTIDRPMRNKLVEAFRHMTVANYARNFDNYNGQHFEVEPKSLPSDSYRYVRSRMVRPGATPIVFNYMMSPAGDGWKILDVYYKGTVSELARRRSEFSTIIRREGAEALLAKLRDIANRVMSNS